MRFGCCVNMLGDKDDPIGRRYLSALKKAQYDYVELPLAQVMDLGNREFDGLLEDLRQLELPCGCCNNLFPAFLRLTGETCAPPGVVNAYLEKAFFRAVKMGARKVIFGSSGAKNIPEGFPYEKAYEQLVELLFHIAETAAGYGVTIGLEPLNHREGNLIRTLEESSRLMQRVGAPEIRLMVDYYHFCMEQEEMAVLEQWRKQLIHVHLAAPMERSFPKREELHFLHLLKRMGYDGDVSIEAYSKNPEKELAEARKQFAGLTE